MYHVHMFNLFLKERFLSDHEIVEHIVVRII